MNEKRFEFSLLSALSIVFLLAAPASARAQSAQPREALSQRTASSATQTKQEASPADDFAEMSYTDNQKEEIDKIHHETELSKAAVVRDSKLNEDQKNAMLLGYTRMEYGRKFQVLSPQQQKIVRQRVLARREADRKSGKNSMSRK